MTSQGRAVSSFARAVKTGSPNIVVAAAAELSRLSLADAFSCCACSPGRALRRPRPPGQGGRPDMWPRSGRRPTRGRLTFPERRKRARRAVPSGGTGCASRARTRRTWSSYAGARRVGTARALTGRIGVDRLRAPQESGPAANRPGVLSIDASRRSRIPAGGSGPRLRRGH